MNAASGSSLSPYAAFRTEFLAGAKVRLVRWNWGALEAPSPRVAHPTWEITWVESGHTGHDVAGVIAEANAGQVVMVPAGVEHRTIVAARTQSWAMHLDPAMVLEIADAMGPQARCRKLVAGVLPSANRIIALGTMLVEEARERAPGAALAMEALTVALIVEALRRGPAESTGCNARDPRIARAIDRIESCHDQCLSIGELAGTAGMSRFHFSRLFRTQTGRSPYQYVVEVRVSRAAALLRRGHHSVTEAAFSVGFNDLGRFSRSFRKIIGCQPSDLATPSRRRSLKTN